MSHNKDKIQKSIIICSTGQSSDEALPGTVGPAPDAIVGFVVLGTLRLVASNEGEDWYPCGDCSSDDRFTCASLRACRGAAFPVSTGLGATRVASGVASLEETPLATLTRGLGTCTAKAINLLQHCNLQRREPGGHFYYVCRTYVLIPQSFLPPFANPFEAFTATAFASIEIREWLKPAALLAKPLPFTICV